jgi:hypothetical protein
VSSPRLLFVPVSGPLGMGEYARSLALATAASQRWPHSQIRFVLSREAPYAQDPPFATTMLPASATFHTKEVISVLDDFRPQVVVFDNAGRTAQLRAARATGARIVFVSSRRRQRHRAFRSTWMRLLDEHWIAYPRFIAGDLGMRERLKLRLLRRPKVRFLDAVLPEPDPMRAAAVLRRFDLQANAYLLIVPGGGTGHPGASHAPEVLAMAARQLALAGVPTLLVGASLKPMDAAAARLRISPRLPMADLCELIRGAAAVVSNGGDTMMQVLACERPCIAVPIAPDQPHRIRKCLRAGLIVSAPLDAMELQRIATRLLADEARRGELSARAAQAGIRNGLNQALEALEGLSC